MNHRQARDLVAWGIGAWERDDFETALETFRRVLDDHPDFADVHNRAGLCAAMLGDHEGALEHFEAAIERNPRYAEALVNLGIILNETGQHEEAREAFATAREIDSPDEAGYPSELGNRIAVAHAQLGDLYLASNRTDEAMDHYRTALSLRPRFMDIRFKYAESLIGVGALEDAKGELEEILDARPSFVQARIRLGVVLQKLGDVVGAISQWQRSAAEAPQDTRPAAYLASVHADETSAEA